MRKLVLCFGLFLCISANADTVATPVSGNPPKIKKQKILRKFPPHKARQTGAQIMLVPKDHAAASDAKPVQK